MKQLSILLATLGLAAAAQAATVSFQYGLPIVQTTTEINEAGLLGLFNPALGTLTDVKLTYFSAGTSIITLGNTAAQDQNARATSAMDVQWSSSLGALDALLVDEQLQFTTGASLSYAPGQTRIFGPLTDSKSDSPDVSTLLFSLTGVGTFALRCETQTSITTVGGGGNVQATQDTVAGCGAQITYTYTPGDVEPPTNVPEPASLGLVALALAGAAGKSRRRKA